MPDMSPFTLPYDGTAPRLEGPPVHAGPGAAVLGRVTMGSDAWLGAGAVIRADGHYVAIGDGFRLGARGTVHIAHDVYPTHVGHGVTAGTNAVIHACDIGENCHLGRDVVILDGSKVGAGAAFADGALVYPRSEIEGGWLYAGRPARPERRLGPDELAALHARSRGEADEARELPDGGEAEWKAAGFAAATAATRGRVVVSPDVGIWYGCVLDAGRHEIAIGASSNIQDNTVIRCEARDVHIGRESTVGHNVTISDSVVGSGSLVGIGADLAPGTVVEDDVLVAAGARTEPGQRLDAGWLYAGAPARKLRPLDERTRAIIAKTWPQYCDYARKYRVAEQAALRSSARHSRQASAVVDRKATRPAGG